MIVTYNDVTLENAEIQSIHRTSVWDSSHTDLLYVLWVVGLVAFYAPNGFPPAVSVNKLRPFKPDTRSQGTGASAIKRFADWVRGRDAAQSPASLRRPTVAEKLTPDARTKYGPILTDVTLRNRLMTPRKKLKITGYDWTQQGGIFTPYTLLESPAGNYVSDPANGPHPLALDILSGQDMGFGVFFQIETAVLPCDDQSDRLVLSHRWDMTHAHDENQYLTRVIEGEVVLNGSMINTFGINPDHLRSQLFHPIPLGHKRTVPFVAPSSDGLTYRYRIEDHDQTITFDAGDSGATHIEISEKMTYLRPKAADLYDRGASLFGL